MFSSSDILRFKNNLEGGPFLIYGAAYSGKSQWIHETLPEDKNISVLGTADPMEPAFAFRLKSLKEKRPNNWKTIDTIEKLTSDILAESQTANAVVVDSMNQWLAAEMRRMAPGLTVEQLYHRVREHYRSFISEVLGSPVARQKLVLITSEVSAGIAPQEATARIFRQSVAEMNLALSQKCLKIIQIELGVPRLIK